MTWPTVATLLWPVYSYTNILQAIKNRRPKTASSSVILHAWTTLNSCKQSPQALQTTPNLNCMRIGYFQKFRQLNLFKPLYYRGNTNHRVAQQWSTRVPPLLTRKCSLVLRPHSPREEEVWLHPAWPSDVAIWHMKWPCNHSTVGVISSIVP